METSRLIAAFEGSLSADALSMPVHWYYDRAALAREYGKVDHFIAPRNPHTGSFMGKASYNPPNERADILHDQTQYWGKSEIHYHQFLKAGENTLNYKLARELFVFIKEHGGYEPDAWLGHYIKCMLKAGWHRDTYVESYHRDFFKNYALGKAPRKSGAINHDIGGLATVPALIAGLAITCTGISVSQLEKIAREHVAFTHRDPALIEAAGTLVRMLYSIADGQSLRAAIRSEAREWLSSADADALTGDENNHVIGARFSPACPIKSSMPASLYLAWKYQGHFADGIIANAMAGGDNCHRGSVVGSLLGADCGAIPEKFRVA
jgi:ADP-ribosyl-[dinitrogen reductase] hydrolase